MINASAVNQDLLTNMKEKTMKALHSGLLFGTLTGDFVWSVICERQDNHNSGRIGV